MGAHKMDRSYYSKAILDALRSSDDDSMKVLGGGAVTRDVERVRASDRFNEVFQFVHTKKQEAAAEKQRLAANSRRK